MAKVPEGMWKRADHQEVMEIDKRTRVDLCQHDRCAVAQRRLSILKSIGLFLT
jgi:hypothetical protein